MTEAVAHHRAAAAAAAADDDDDKLLQAGVMQEVRRLRLQLELCIDNNDQLRQRLEDCARHHHAAPRCSSCSRRLTARTGSF